MYSFEIESGTLVKCRCDAAEIIIPEGVAHIGKFAFFLKKVKKVVIPEGITHIGKKAFANCKQLETVVFPKTLTTIEDGAFNGCISLKEIKMPAGITKLGSAFSGCSSLEKVEIKEGLEIIESYTFSGCRLLKTIIIPSSVVRIGNNVFSGCENVTICAPAGSYANKYNSAKVIESEKVIFTMPSSYDIGSYKISKYIDLINRKIHFAITDPNTKKNYLTLDYSETPLSINRMKQVVISVVEKLWQEEYTNSPDSPVVQILEKLGISIHPDNINETITAVIENNKATVTSNAFFLLKQGLPEAVIREILYYRPSVLTTETDKMIDWLKKIFGEEYITEMIEVYNFDGMKRELFRNRL